jgi:hypothetical protein
LSNVEREMKMAAWIDKEVEAVADQRPCQHSGSFSLGAASFIFAHGNALRMF